MTFNEIAGRYVDYVQRKFVNPTIVFDGYAAPSTKDQEHQRRCAVPLSRFASINQDVKVSYSQQRYLTLRENKIELVEFLPSFLLL